MRRQRAQDQVEVAERVWPYADAGGGSCWYAAGKARSQDGTVGGCGADGSGGSRRTGGELRKKLRADLLKKPILCHTRAREYPLSSPLSPFRIFESRHCGW